MSRNSALVLVGTAIAAGVALRLPGLWTEFWLDEVWTWRLAREIDGALDVFRTLHHSNNHHLNTLYVYWLGDREPVALYRIPALVLGTLTIALAGVWGWRRSPAAAVLAAWLVAVCFALVHFSSEARGSGPTVAFALAALCLLERDLERPRPATALAYGACVVAGFLCQLVFVGFWIGSVAHAALALWGRGARGVATGLLRLHAVPLAAFGALAWVDLRWMKLGGGPPTPLATWVSELAGSSLGLPMLPGFALPGALVLLVALGLAVRQRARAGDPFWIVLLIATVAPWIGIAAVRPDTVSSRYFLIPTALLLLGLAPVLADALRRSGAPRALAAIALVGFACGHAVHLARFVADGRGDYRGALETMARESSGRRIVVGSDHDFRNGMLLLFHARRLAPATTLDYRRRRSWPAEGPEWLIRHSLARRVEPDPAVTDGAGRTYRFFRSYPHGSLSGFHWSLYRNTGKAPAPGSP